MAANRIALIGLSVLGLTATITNVLAQNTSNPMSSGNTTNPILSGNTVAQPPPVPVSPALNTAILAPTIGRNSITGLPCSAGAVVIPPPPSTSGSTPLQTLQSVFGSSPSC
jgi:hypothetical protein